MFDLENEIKNLRERNDELVQSLQYWKITAAQRENEKVELIKEVNELRLKLGRIRSGGSAQIRQLDAALQSASQEALTHLVQASSAVARSMELAKAYIRDRQELDRTSLRWNNISGTPTPDRVNRVPPLLIGGQSIQPVVSLSRTFINSTGSRSANRNPNRQNHNVTERAVPVHMLQDVYIPLTRIDAPELMNNMEIEQSNNMNDSTEDLGLEDSSEQVLDGSQNLNDVDETTQRLEAVIEDEEPEDGNQTNSTNDSRRMENPLEGPSWLLDMQSTETKKNKSLINLEPDSTTELEDTMDLSPAASAKQTEMGSMGPVGFEYSPTVRRRKRTSSRSATYTPPPRNSRAQRTPRAPHYSPRRNGMNERVLQVLVAKMDLDVEDGDVSLPKKAMRDASPRRSPSGSIIESPIIPVTVTVQKHVEPVESRQAAPRGRPPIKEVTPKRMMRFDAPSPNGATDARVMVSESKIVQCGSAEASGSNQPGSRRDRHNSARCDAQEASCNAKVAPQDTREARAGARESRRDKQQPRPDAQDSEPDTNEPRRDTKDNRRERSNIYEINNSDSCCDTRDSDSSTERTEGRVRRARKAVTYKEKPLNRKLRR